MDISAKAAQLVSQMTLEEAASLCSGQDFWHTKAIQRLNIPSIMMSDGPHGLRKQPADVDHLGINNSIPATCFPASCATACSFDRELLSSIGKALAEEAREQGISVILGPGVNIKRNPLCGRNFEYFSEDPYLAGELAAAYINGVQSQGVGTSLKHFAVNNQETRRVIVDAVVDERALREIYLAGFEKAVKEAAPRTVMCSYNRLGGTYASEHSRLLTKILRDEWGYEGMVVSDWGAVCDRVAGVAAGLDLEMPGVTRDNDRFIIKAVQDGTLDEEAVRRCARRVVELVLRSVETEPADYDKEAHHTLARRAAAESAVLLKNEGALLPVQTDKKLLIVGAFAKEPRYQGAGSSRVTPHKVDCPLDALNALGYRPEYARGYELTSSKPNTLLMEEACKKAASADVVLVFAGLPDGHESEGFDRTHMNIPESHDLLIDRLVECNPNIAVVLMGGAPMDISRWKDRVPAILLAYLGGEAGGSGIADVLCGKVCPGGKLAETWPVHYEDTLSAAYFPGYERTVEHRESIFVGYRYFDTAGVEVAFPFGHGLSYAAFRYHGLSCRKEQDSVTVSFTVKNTGSVYASEVPQVYVSHRSQNHPAPLQQLKGFQKLRLAPGEETVCAIKLDRRAFSMYDTSLSGWRIEGGEYEIRVGSSSRDIRLVAAVELPGDPVSTDTDGKALYPAYFDIKPGMIIPDKDFEALLGHPIPPRNTPKGEPFSINSTLPDIKGFLGGFLRIVANCVIRSMAGGDPESLAHYKLYLNTSPMRMLLMGAGSMGITRRMVDGIVDLCNGKFFKGMGKILTKNKQL